MRQGFLRDPYLPLEAEIIEYHQESPTLFTFHLKFLEQDQHDTFTFAPGQFNMVYLYGVGEVPISIVSDPEDKHKITHTLRAVGRVTKALQKLQKGDRLGIRGPYGSGWPVKHVRGQDIVVLTGGLGCAPTVAMINYMMKRRHHYGEINILQGVKHSDDFIFRQQYEQWQKIPKTEVYIAADQADANWPWKMGYVTDMIEPLNIHPEKTTVMMCGPEIMMHLAIQGFIKKGLKEEAIYLSMERNMECALGQCGHCQYGGLFVCKEGPVFSYPQIKSLFSVKGF